MIRHLLFLVFLVSFESFGQPPSEIYVFDLEVKTNNVRVSNGHNITNHPGYDNQPFFHPKHNRLYFAQADTSGRTDILVVDLSKNKVQKVTSTSEREYSPTVTPDEKFLSCIIQRDDGAQNLGKYPIGGGEPVIIINDLTVGYHAWVDDVNLILFVLGEPHTLRWYSVAAGKDSVIAQNIGRSLHKIPGSSDMSYVDKSEEKWRIKRMEVKSKKTSDITETIPGHEDLAWTPDGKMLMSDGDKLYYFQEGKSEGWREVEGSAIMKLKGITRISVNKKGDKIAIVASE